MGIINIFITESSQQTTPGIPNTLAISTNEPAVVFYTLDGTIPNTFSPVYMAPISLPQNLLTVNVNIFATNQFDSSSVITKQYTAIVSEIKTAAGDRLPHSAVTTLNNNTTSNSLFPFGTNSPNPNFNYLNPGSAGTTVYDQSKPATSNGFDANGNPTTFTNAPISDFKYKQVYSTTDVEGSVSPGVGNLPAKTTVIGKSSAVEYTQLQSSFADKVFNPRALVIFQDSTTEDPTNPVHINRASFSLENPEIVRDGALLYNSNMDIPPPMGSFVNRHYNPRTNMMTHSYYDNTQGRWIFSSFPYQPTTKDVGALYQMAFSRPNGGSGKVFKWIPFARRFLT